MNDYPDMLHRVRLMRGWVLPEEDIHALGAVLERLDVLEAWFEAENRLQVQKIRFQGSFATDSDHGASILAHLILAAERSVGCKCETCQKISDIANAL